MATTKTTRTAKAASAAAVAPQAAPATPVAATPAAQQLYTLGGQYVATLAKAGMQTLQRAAPGQGTNWRQAGHKAPSVRAAALAALQVLGSTFTQAQAVAALAPLAASGALGCSSPATRFSKFLRSGHVVPAQA